MKRLLHKLLLLIVSTALILQSSSIALAKTESAVSWFADVSLGKEGFYDDVIYAGWELGFFYGTAPEQFSPRKPVTLAESVTFLGRVYEKLSGIKLEESYSVADIDPGRFYSRYAIWAREKGLLYPFFQKSFQPEHPMTREDTAILLYRFLLLFDTTKMIGMENAFHYADEEELSTEGQAAVYTLSAIPLVPYDRCDYEKKWLAPAKNTLRREMASYTMRIWRIAAISMISAKSRARTEPAR